MVKYICDKCKKEGTKDSKGFPSLYLTKVSVNRALDLHIDLCPDCAREYSDIRESLDIEFQVALTQKLNEWFSQVAP